MDGDHRQAARDPDDREDTRHPTGGVVRPGPAACDGGQAAVRPALPAVLSGAELRRWYWLRSELVELAHLLGVGPSGGKQELTDRLATVLDGKPAPAAAPRRRPARRPLEGALSRETVIPAGQPSSQHLRAFFIDQVGPGFAFDAAMRDFLADSGGATLGEAVDHWHATRSAAPSEIGDQFELNRFTRQWWREHPDGSRDDLRRAWLAYRRTPTDQRDRA